MSRIFKLYKIQIDEKYDIFKVHNIKKWLWAVIKYVFLIAVVLLGVYLLLSNIFIYGFKVNAQLLSIVFLATQIISLVFALGNVVRALFFSKDNELLLVLPVTSNQLFISKIMVIYTQELIISAIYTLPLLVVLGLFGNFGWLFFALIPIFVIILPLFPIGVAFLLSIPTMFIIKYLRKHLVLSVIIILISTVLIVALYMGLLTKISGSFNIAKKQIETVQNFNNTIMQFGNLNIFYLLLAKSMIIPSEIYWLIAFMAICGVLFVAGCLIVKPFYYKTIIENNVKPVKTAKKQFRKDKPFMSLLKKEILCVFRSPNYLFQYFLFTLLMPFIVLTYDKLLLTLVVNQAGKTMIAGSHLLIVSIMAMLSNVVSASAISREGGNFYLMKTTPVTFYTQTFAKLTFNAIFTVGSIILTAIVSLFYIDVSVVLSTTIAVLFASLGHMFMSFEFDLKEPSFDHYDEGEGATMGKNTAKSIIWALVLSLLMSIVVFTTAVNLDVLVTWGILIFACVIFCLVRAHMLYVRVYFQYDRLER